MGNTGARMVHRLSALTVARTCRPGYYCDGGGLYLQIAASGSKSWVFRFRRSGRLREMGLGSVNAISLAGAREQALSCRRLLLDNVDPIDARNIARAGAAREVAKAMTFARCAAAYIKAHKVSWKNDKHIDQWRNTLATYADPVFGEIAVKDVDTGLVMQVLDPIWQLKPETASRLRGRIEAVLDWATVRRHRTGENPARWRGHLDKLLPARSKVQTVQHHAALPYQELPDFFREVGTRPGVAAQALALLILTAARTGEIIGAGKSEFDLQRMVWNVPICRMKAKKPHRVPLSPPAQQLIEEITTARRGELMFGGRAGKPVSNMAMLKLLERMERTDLTVHGFRSTFRDWVAECTTYPSEIAEAALAHTVGNKVEAAYRRGDLLEKRRELMNDWAAYCTSSTGGAGVGSLDVAAPCDASIAQIDDQIGG